MWRQREPASIAFYDRLFEIAPDARSLFKGDLDVQRRQFMAALGHIVMEIEKPDIVVAAVKSTARRHLDYGVQPHHYDQVGAALVWTIGQILGPRFKPVWETAYARISKVMQEEAYPAPKKEQRPERSAG